METIINFIKETASFITAGGVICAFALAIGRYILKNALKPFDDKIDNMDKLRIEQHKETKTELAVMRKELDENSLNTMKNTICNENIPISERLIVGKKYIDKGGNGAVKIYIHKLEEEFEKKLQESERF